MESDVIYRQDAIDVVCCERGTHGIIKDIVCDKLLKTIIDNIRNIPSAQPYTDEQIQRMSELEQAEIEKAYELGRKSMIKTGKWIRISPAKIYECSECGQNVMTVDIERYKYCPCCGSKLEE